MSNGHNIPRLTVVSQLVQDIRFGGGSHREELAETIGRLRRGLRKRAYIPGNKLNATWKSASVSPDGTLELDIYGGMLKSSDLQDGGLDVHIRHKIPLDLKTPDRLQHMEPLPELGDILADQCNDVQTDLGGNAQNMAVDLALLLASGKFSQQYELAILSSSDPFRLLSGEVRDKLAPLLESKQIQYLPLQGIPDRVSIQMPWQDGKEGGDFALTTEPLETSPVLQSLLKQRGEIFQIFQQANGFIASDPLFPTISMYGNPSKGYFTMINASTAFRSMVANMAYSTGVVLPMNDKEAKDVIRVFEQRGSEMEAHDVREAQFPTPFASNGVDVDPESILQLDDSLWRMRQYNPLHTAYGRTCFNFPITFGGDGGMVVGTGGSRNLVCFTTCVHPDKERYLHDEFGDPSQTTWSDRPLDMGAGDSSAAIISLFNTVDPLPLITPHLEGREAQNESFQQNASTVFVSAMSRIVGSFLIRTKKTHWSNIDLSKIDQLFDTVAREAVMTSRKLRRSDVPYRSSTMDRFGIRVVTWPLGEIAHPTPSDE